MSGSAIAGRHQRRARDLADLDGMLVCHLAASDDGRPNHECFAARSRAYAKYLSSASFIGTRGCQPSIALAFRLGYVCLR